GNPETELEDLVRLNNPEDKKCYFGFIQGNIFFIQAKESIKKGSTTITAPWPYYKWRIDIAGSFPEGPGKVKVFIVAMDYFTKWIKAKAVATISGSQVKKFVWDNIVCRFGLPREIVSDNEAVIPAKVGMPTYRTVVVDVVHNDEELQLNLDLLEERHEHAAIREAKAKLKMTKYYNARVQGVTFRPGDFVYHSNDASYVVDGGKLGQSGKDLMRSQKHLEMERTC
ncbi:reverse transcriptase domain-containing protein, partial [Tanacetum coccineum]